MRTWRRAVNLSVDEVARRLVCQEEELRTALLEQPAGAGQESG